MLTMPRFQIPKENPFQKSKAYNLSYWQNLDASIQFVTDLADCSYTSATWADVAGFSNNTTLSRNKNGLFAQGAVPSTMDVGLAAFLLTRSAMVSDQSNHRFLDGHISERWWYGSARTTTRKKTAMPLKKRQSRYQWLLPNSMRAFMTSAESMDFYTLLWVQGVDFWVTSATFFSEGLDAWSLKQIANSRLSCCLTAMENRVARKLLVQKAS